MFVSTAFREGKAQRSHFSSPLIMGVKEASVDEMVRTSTCNLTIIIVTFFSYRFINCNSSFSYSPGSPACPALFGTFHFIATPHHGLFKGKRGAHEGSRELWASWQQGQCPCTGQQLSGDDVCPWQPWPTTGQSSFQRTEQLKVEFLKQKFINAHKVPVILN